MAGTGEAPQTVIVATQTLDRVTLPVCVFATLDEAVQWATEHRARASPISAWRSRVEEGFGPQSYWWDVDLRLSYQLSAGIEFRGPTAGGRSRRRRKTTRRRG
jgi:hypothetical protein